MALLTNVDLKDLIVNSIEEYQKDSTKLLIKDFFDENLTPVGYDLRVGESYVLEGEQQTLKKDKAIKIGAGKMALIKTLEEIRMPQLKTLSALINSKVSLTCKGLSNISTTVDADWKGCLLVAVHNSSNQEIELNFEDSFCTIIFIENKTPAQEGKYSKPDGRSDILISAFAKNTKEIVWLSFLMNCLPVLIVVVGFLIAINFFSSKESAHLLAASIAVSVFLANYISGFINVWVGRIINKK